MPDLMSWGPGSTATPTGRDDHRPEESHEICHAAHATQGSPAYPVLGEESGDLDQELGDFSRSSPLWKDKEELLRSTPGVGLVLSVTLLSHLPELDTLNLGEIAALLGVAPFNRDSGTLGGKRTVWGPEPGAGYAVHGCFGCHPIQSSAPRLLPALVRCRQAQEGGTHRLHSQAADQSQRHGQGHSPLELSIELPEPLISKTVASSSAAEFVTLFGLDPPGSLIL